MTEYLGIFADKNSSNILFVDCSSDDDLSQEQIDELAMQEFKGCYPELVTNFRLVEAVIK